MIRCERNKGRSILTDHKEIITSFKKKQTRQINYSRFNIYLSKNRQNSHHLSLENFLVSTVHNAL